MKMRFFGLFAACAIVLAMGSACTEETAQSGEAQVGGEGAACYENGTCDDGLVCASEICVRPPDAGSEDADVQDAGGDASDATASDTGPPSDTGDVSDADSLDASDSSAGEDANDAQGSSDASEDAQDSSDASEADGSSDADMADAQPQQPTCTIDSPADGAARQFDEDWTFAATATDPQDGDLSGAQIRWESDQDGLLGTGASLQTTLSTSGTHDITCTATDTDGNSASAQISVVVESPRAEIWHPSDGETRNANSQIPFTGRGFDAEDGDLPGSSLVWTSSIDGQFGTGKNFNAQLSAGTNVVTLTVTDSDGNTASSSLTLNIQ